MGFLTIIAYILMGIGGLAILAGAVWFLFVAFKESIWWGIGCLCLGPVSLIFLVKYWHDSWKPWALQIVGLLVFLGGTGLFAFAVPTPDLPDDSYSYEEYESEEYEDSGYEDYEDTGADGDDATDGGTSDGEALESEIPDGDSTIQDGTATSDDGTTSGAADLSLGATSGLPAASLGNSSSPSRASQRPTTPPSRLSGSFGRGSDEESISMDFAEDYIDRRLKITKNNGTVVYCRLIEVTEDSLVIQQSLGGGHVKFTLPKTSISKLAKDDR